MTPLQITCERLELSELETVGELSLSLVKIYFSVKTQKSKMCNVCKANIVLHHYQLHRLYQY